MVNIKKIDGAAKPTSDNSHPEILSMGWIDKETASTLLEVGCGGGQFLEKAVKRGLDVYAIDADIRMILEARKKAGKVNGSAEHIIQKLIGDKLPDIWPTFDYIVSFEVIEHTDNPLEAMKWIRANLRPGGWVVGSVPDNEKEKVARGNLITEFPKSDEDLVRLNKHKSAFDSRSIQVLLSDSGFVKIEARRVNKGKKKRLLFRARRPKV